MNTEINSETNDSTLKLKGLTMGINKCNLVKIMSFATISSKFKFNRVLLEWRILKYVDFSTSNHIPMGNTVLKSLLMFETWNQQILHAND